MTKRYNKRINKNKNSNMKNTMNKLTLVLVLFAFYFSLSTVWAQAPQSFEYQAVVRDGSGNILISQNVGIQITIKQGSPSGTNVYQETFASTTNLYGLVNLQIGTGATGDDFTIIDWAAGPYFIEVALDVTGGTSYTIMGTSQLLSVPYALHAKTVESFDACSLFSYYYADRDNDGFGDAFNVVFSCTPPTGYIPDNTDCNDNNINTNPSATEICDGIDNNCDGQIDEGVTYVLQYVDADGDDYGDINSPPNYFCTLQPGFSLTNDDCDDSGSPYSHSNNPGAAEICGDGMDNDCDGNIDEGCGCINGEVRPCFNTNAYGSCVGQEICVNGVWSACDASIPSEEICNGIDDDCDGQIDEGCCIYTYYHDNDNDSWGDGSNSITSFSSTPPLGYVNRPFDCDDNNNTVFPMAPEINGDGIDNDCFGGDNVAASNTDMDGDGITEDYDCDETDGNVYPGAIEPCGGNLDINCDGIIN